MPIICRVGGGAGGDSAGGLNFTVNQYTSTPTGTVSENTIGVVTSTAISDWVMSATRPTGAAGLVWIELAAASDVAFSAIDEKTVMVYPKSVKQYRSGAWNNCDAYIYQNGWKQFSNDCYFLFSSSGQAVAFSAGEGGFKLGSTSIGTTIAISAKCTSEQGSDTQFVFSDTAFDLSPYTTLAIDYTGAGTTKTYSAGLVVGVSSSGSPTVAYSGGTISSALAQNTVAVASGSSGLSGTLTVDISSVNQSGYIVAGMFMNNAGVTGNQTGTATITNIYVM